MCLAQQIEITEHTKVYTILFYVDL